MIQFAARHTKANVTLGVASVSNNQALSHEVMPLPRRRTTRTQTIQESCRIAASAGPSATAEIVRSSMAQPTKIGPTLDLVAYR